MELNASSGDKFLEGYTGFSFKLFNQLAKVAKPSKNLVLGYPNLAILVAIAGTAAQGGSQRQITQALGVPSLEEDALTGFCLLAGLSSLAAAGGSGIKLAHYNGIFVQDYVTPGFIQKVENLFLAHVTATPYAKRLEAARVNLNRNIAPYTGGHMQELIGENDMYTDSSVILLSALYLEVALAAMFSSEDTKGLFWLSDYQSIVVPTVRQTADMAYAKLEKLTVVQLGCDGRAHMLIFVPNDGCTQADVNNQLTSLGALDAIITRLRVATVKLSLPRLSVCNDGNHDYNAAFAALGIEDVFVPEKANFNAIGSPNLYLSKILHQAKFVLTGGKKGRDATANAAIEVTASRGFRLMVRDESTGIILMDAWVANPLSA